MVSIELAVICFAAFVLVILLALRARRSHNQQLRRGASSGFYDMDVARYGTTTAGSSLMEKSILERKRPLAPSFSASTKTGGQAMPIPAGPPPSFDLDAAQKSRPQPDGSAPAAPSNQPPALPPLAQPLPPLRRPA
jgi:hypothetical protein